MQEFAGFGTGDAGVGGEPVEVVEAVDGGPGRESGFPELREAFLEAVESFAGMRIPRGNGAAGTGVASFQMNFADGEADGAAFVDAEELIFPKRGDTGDFEGGTKAEAEVVHGKAGEAARVRAEPGGNGLQGSRGDDGGAVGDGVVGETAFGITNDDLLLEKDAKPFRGFLVGFREGEGAGRNLAAIARNGESNGADVGGIAGADEVNHRSALAVDPFAVDGVKRPGAVVDESTGRRDARLGDFDGVEGFDRMETDIGELRSRFEHGKRDIRY